MTTAVKRYPTFKISFYTQENSYNIVYDTQKTLTSKDFEESLISFSTKNSMSDDSPVFSLVLLAKEKWDTLLSSGDAVRIRVYPDRTKPSPDNPYIMVGMISDIRRDGEYADGTILYRITGRAMTKALIDFEVGVIQEVSANVPTVGWLPDGEDKGLKFSGNTAAGIGDELMNRFIYQYATYEFAGGKSLPDFLEHSFSSWEEYESLGDSTPFINYEGSIRQFLDDVTAKPFNELFFEFTKDGKCAAMMRPTPFDPDKWAQLPVYRITSDVVVEETFGKSDAEMYSLFVVQAPNLAEFNNIDLGVFPKFHPDLIKKYGYKRLDAQNRYLLSGTITASTNPNVQNITGDAPKYGEVLGLISDNKFDEPEVLRTQRNVVFSEMATTFPTLTKGSINKIIDALKDNDLTSERYRDILSETGTSDQKQSVNKENSIATDKLEAFTQKLFNWYCENANFYNGDIRIIGSPAYRVGSKLYYVDFERDTTWEFYVEAIQHEFSFANGYTTVVGVTRGLPNGGSNRFGNLWGKSKEFLGGYLGELSLAELQRKKQEASSTPGDGNGGGDWGGGTGSGGAMGALQTAQAATSRKSKYVFGGGRTGKNPFLGGTVLVDCSSFIWWCFYLNGVSLKGGKTGMTTDTIASDPQLRTISSRGSSKTAAKAQLQKGDLVYFDTYKRDGHIGIYNGNGKFIGAQSSSGIAEADMTSGYWWQKFNGHVKRL